jgi:hypothetical protein
VYAPRVGDVVTFEYVQAREGKPIDAKITKIRPELTWDDLVGYFHTQSPLEQSGNLISPKFSKLIICVLEITSQAFNLTPNKSMGYWTKNEGEKIKQLLSTIARKNNRDPLRAEDWYTLTKEFVLAEAVKFHF